VTDDGSSHEPIHVGFIGDGLLDRVAARRIFTSPSATEMQTIIKAVDGGAGILAIIKNYEGDIMTSRPPSN
jgi:phosphoenolpyruvate---glycerone phosphotransferase subunit DhaK